jgi:hypothetical protein
MILLLVFVGVSVGTAKAVPFPTFASPVIRSAILIAALKLCATQKHPLLTFAIPTLAAKAAAVVNLVS